MLKEKITNIYNNHIRGSNETTFGVLVISSLLILYYLVFARFLLSGQYISAGDTYVYWSFRYLILYSIQHFDSLPWWDPTNYGGYPLYYHFLSGPSNYLSPYYLPSLIIFKILNYFVDVNINRYIAFHQTIYIVTLNIIAIYLIGRELTTNRIAAVLPAFIFSFSYFQLLNFHDSYAVEAMIAPLFYIFALIRLNNKRTTNALILFLVFLGLLFASLNSVIVMSAFYWGVIFSVLVLIFNMSLIRDAYYLFLKLIKTLKGKIIAILLLLLLMWGLLASLSPFHYNEGHVLRYRGGHDGKQPVIYETSGGLTNDPIPIESSEIWSIFLNWLPFTDMHDNLLRFASSGHENRYIGLVTLPLILSAFVLGLRNRYVYIMFITYFLCNGFIIYTVNNTIYKLLIDNSDVFRNMRNMSTVFPRGGPPLFLMFIAGIGFDRLLKISPESEKTSRRNIQFQKFYKNAITFLLTIACIFTLSSIISRYSPLFYWMRHSLAHIGISLLIFTAFCRILYISKNKISRGVSIFCLLLFTFTDLTVAASSYNNKNQHNFNPDDFNAQMMMPYNKLAHKGSAIPDNIVFKTMTPESEPMFPDTYFGMYHSYKGIAWSVKEWLMFATRKDCQKFLPNWDSQQLRMIRYPDFRLFRNSYYLPFEKIKELDSYMSTCYGEPAFYLHDKQLVNSQDTSPQESISGEYEIEKYTPNTVVMKTITDRNGFLYFLDNYDRFWSAYIDSKKVKVHRANFTFKAIELPAGAHVISWTYNPWPVKMFYMIFYLFLIITLIAVVFLIKDEDRTFVARAILDG